MSIEPMIDVPFVPLKNINYSERGKLRSQNREIAGIKVCFKLGDLAKEKADAVFIPHSPKHASKRSVMGHFVRNPEYEEDTLAIGRIMEARYTAARDMPFSYGEVIYTEIKNNTSSKHATTDFGRPSYFMHGFTVTGQEEPDLQFNAVRYSIVQTGMAALYLAEEDGILVNTIALPAIGTGPAGHLMAYQSARAIYAGINDLGQKIAGQNHKLHFNIVIKDDARHAPMIDEFLEVANDLSYLNVPKEGEVGKKIFCPDAYIDHIDLEEALYKAYKREQQYNANYPRYNS